MDDFCIGFDAQHPRRIEFDPVVTLFGLETVDEELFEKPLTVEHAVAHKRQILRRRAFHKARRKSSETAVAERRVLFFLFEIRKA